MKGMSSMQSADSRSAMDAILVGVQAGILQMLRTQVSSGWMSDARLLTLVTPVRKPPKFRHRPS